MAQRRKPDVTRESAIQRAMRDQEVLRANRELAAYFKGGRTEREARAALKIVKAFVRDRERRDEGSRPPLPGAHRAEPKEVVSRKTASARRERQRRKPRRKARDKSSTSPTTSTKPPVDYESPQLPESDDRTPE